MGHFKLFIIFQSYNGKPINNNRYAVNNEGQIYDLLEKHYLDFNIHSKGYYQKSLYGDNRLIHKIVAEAFIPNFNNKPMVDHINGNKLDNNVNNLRWVTAKENNNNPITKVKNAEHSFKKGNVPTNQKPVLQMDLEGNVIGRYQSIRNAASGIGRNNCDSITKCCNGLQKKSCGFKWSWE